MKLFDLTNKVAIVTGGGRGNGKAIANGLFEYGAKVISVDLNHDEDYQNEIIKIRGDVTEIEVIKETYSKALAISKQLILVNNAGITIPISGSYPIESWDKTIKTNLTAPYLWLEELRNLGGFIIDGAVINITSLSAERAFPDNPAYVAAKGGLKMLSKAYAQELSKYNIRVNSLGPGYIKTKMTINSYLDDNRRDQRQRQTMLGRWGESEDLIGGIVFLASNASSYVTGQDLYIDGGWLAKGLIED
jgi:NAD(P)-dependent dehydrogenase (short-subunit alcohol dehydrogenase family)